MRWNIAIAAGMLAVLFAGSVVRAQEVRDTICVFGQVVDSLTGNPVQDAMVKLNQRLGGSSGGGGAETSVLDSMLTDAQGAFDFGRFLPEGRIIVSADKDGYRENQVAVEADSLTDTAEVRLALYPDSTDIPLPELITVADGVDPRPVLSWHPVDSATSYMVQLDTVGHFASPMISAPVADTSYAPLVDLPVGTIYWRVSSSLNLAVYTQRSSFEILDPTVPQLIPYEPDSTDETKPTLVWHAVAGASAYTVQIDESADFADPIFSVPTADTSYTPLLDLPAGTIYWRVKSDLNDDYSTVDQFVIRDLTIVELIPYEPELTTEKRPTLAWHPVDGASSYRIQVDNAANFFRVYVDTTVADTCFTPVSDLQEGNVYWRVMADNGTAFSEADNFYILADDVPVPVTFDGDTLTTFRPSFVWHPVDSAASYRIQISDDQTFATTILSTPTADTSYTPLVDLPEGMVYWRVASDLSADRYSPVDRVFLAEESGIAFPGGNVAEGGTSVSSNPFAGTVTIRAHLDERSGAIFGVAAPDGRMLYNVTTPLTGPGTVEFAWDASGMAAGTYVLSVTTGTEMRLRRVMLAR